MFKCRGQMSAIGWLAQVKYIPCSNDFNHFHSDALSLRFPLPVKRSTYISLGKVHHRKCRRGGYLVWCFGNFGKFIIPCSQFNFCFVSFLWTLSKRKSCRIEMSGHEKDEKQIWYPCRLSNYLSICLRASWSPKGRESQCTLALSQRCTLAV